MNRTFFADLSASQLRGYLRTLGLREPVRLERLTRNWGREFTNLADVRAGVARWMEQTCYLRLPEGEEGFALAEAAIVLSGIAEKDSASFLSRRQRPSRALVDELRLSLPLAVPAPVEGAMPVQSLEPVSAADWVRVPSAGRKPALARS